MRIAILTSSRADYGILSPLLKLLYAESDFEVDVIAFGTHLSKKHGYTINEIINDSYFDELYKFDTMPLSDTPDGNIESISRSIKIFGELFLKYKPDLVICLGDRYEMFAACTGIFPYGIRIAHISGGEETIGATDNFYRHAITLMSTFHFASTENYRNRIVSLLGKDQNIYNVGALNYDNLYQMHFLSKDEFKKKYGFEILEKSILITFHPETVDFTSNEIYVSELIEALDELRDYQLIITMPNADIGGDLIRERFENFVRVNNNAFAINSFGKNGYLSCLKQCCMMLGNSSSGFVEASYFSKYVINLGKRQEGRIITPNIRSCNIVKDEIIDAVKGYNDFKINNNCKIYGEGNTAQK